MEPLKSRLPAARSGTAQQGAVLIIAMIVLVLMSLAAMTVIRSTDTGTLVAGNLAFRQSTMHAADVAIDRAWEELVPGSYDGKTYYFSTRQTAAPNDFTSAQTIAASTVWNSADVPCFDARGRTVDCATDTGDYRIQYLIERQCRSDPDLANARDIMIECSVDHKNAASATAAAIAEGRAVAPEDLNIYFRLIIRARGPRGTVGFYEAMVSGPAT